MNAALWKSLQTNSKLPPHSWYLIAATTLSILNRADEVPKVFKQAIGLSPVSPGEKEHAAQLAIARRMREALVKAAAIGGMPKTINALLALRTETPDELLDKPGAISPTSRLADVVNMPAPEILQRGKIFFDKNYGKVAERIMQNMDYSGTEDLGVVARLIYGHIVSNTSVLSPVETSYVLIAGLIPQDLNPQLKGHLKGALNHGSTLEEVQAVRDAVIMICEASGMRRLPVGADGGYGWKSDIANVVN